VAQPIDFIIGGVQKGGTTALFEHMGRDLEVSLSTVKEAHFFDDETLDWTTPDYTAYHALFDPPDGRPRGEATPIYLYWPNALERIAAYNPAVRLILIFRDPVARAWSQWRMEIGRDFDDMAFSRAIRAGRSRVTEAGGYHRVYSYVERGFYARQLAHALTLFSRDQLLLLRAEDLRCDPDRVLGEVARHIGVAEPRGPISPLQANIGGEKTGRMSEEDAVYLQTLYADDLDRFSALSGLDVSGWTRRP
jgi:hypothetical protein